MPGTTGEGRQQGKTKPNTWMAYVTGRASKRYDMCSARYQNACRNVSLRFHDCLAPVSQVPRPPLYPTLSPLDRLFCFLTELLVYDSTPSEPLLAALIQTTYSHTTPFFSRFTTSARGSL